MAEREREMPVFDRESEIKREEGSSYVASPWSAGSLKFVRNHFIL